MAPPKVRKLSERELEVKSNELYRKCAANEEKQVFEQEELLAMGVVTHLVHLKDVCNWLTRRYLFAVMMLNEKPSFRVRSRSMARNIMSIDQPGHRRIYIVVEESGDNGIWVRKLKAKLNIHQTMLKRSLRQLESRKYVKQVRNARDPGKKTVLLSGMQPSDEITGGIWYSEGEVDYEFIRQLKKVITLFVRGRSWRKGPKWEYVRKFYEGNGLQIPGWRNGETTNDEAGKGKKRAASSADIEDFETQPSKKARHDDESAVKAESPLLMAASGMSTIPTPPLHDGHILVPQPPGYERYPTVSHIHGYIDRMGIVENKVLSKYDIKALVNLLVFEGYLEPIVSPAVRQKREMMRREAAAKAAAKSAKDKKKPAAERARANAQAESLAVEQPKSAQAAVRSRGTKRKLGTIRAAVVDGHAAERASRSGTSTPRGRPTSATSAAFPGVGGDNATDGNAVQPRQLAEFEEQDEEDAASEVSYESESDDGTMYRWVKTAPPTIIGSSSSTPSSGAEAGASAKAVNTTTRTQSTTAALTEVPCSHCAVYDLCTEPGRGQINALRCEYLGPWLDRQADNLENPDGVVEVPQPLVAGGTLATIGSVYCGGADLISSSTDSSDNGDEDEDGKKRKKRKRKGPKSQLQAQHRKEKRRQIKREAGESARPIKIE